MDLGLYWGKFLYKGSNSHFSPFPSAFGVYIVLNTNKNMGLLLILKAQPI